MTIGQLIRQHRDARPLTRKELARLCPSWTPDKIKHLELDTVPPFANELQELVDVLNIPQDWVTRALRNTGGKA